MSAGNDLPCIDFPQWSPENTRMSTPFPNDNGHTVTLAALRRYLLALFLFGLLGLVAELLLVKHTEDAWQWVPLLLILASLLVLGWHAADRRATSLRVFQGTMVLFLLSGVAGILLHYQGRAAFQLESTPTLSGLNLFWEAMQTQTPPALAPGVMIQMGFLGLLYTYRHPVLDDSTRKGTFNQRSMT
ncbi:MAG: hypothetical protein A3H28_07485 [Acidobacteria bacterium RIFCSPLOWO2_02_FULL_61_28]|nr:MAG: hypothetical protein A3H28_07485 [Acidobacteria bacterium RIFCSPLOWO2_02_FULL_61_28]